MAHYIAELIQSAEAATGEGRSAKLAECAAAILDLWKHRSHLPHGRRPFEDLEPILNALEALDPCSERVRCYYQPLQEADESEEDPKVRKWLRSAAQLDDSAKILIRYCLARASHTARDKSKAWISAAEAAGLEDGVELPVVRFVKSEADLLESLELGNSDRKRIATEFGGSRDFRKTSDIVLYDLRERLDVEGQSGSKIGTESAAAARKARIAPEVRIKNIPTKRNILAKSKKSVDRAADRGRKVTSRTQPKRTRAKAKRTKMRS